MTGNIRYHCPFCPGLGRRNDDLALSVNWNREVYHCFRCGTSGRIGSLPPNFRHPLLILKEDKRPHEQLKIKGMVSLRDSKIGQGYFRARGLDPEPLGNSVFVSGKKLVFPFYASEGDVVYYVTRKMWGFGKRYENMAAAIKDIYTPLGVTLPTSRLVLVEGIFDALSVWQWLKIDSVSLLGINVNSFKIKRILECTHPRAQVLLLLDAGEYQTALLFYKELRPLRKGTVICKLDEGDPNEIGREKLWKKLKPYLSSAGRKISSSTD